VAEEGTVFAFTEVRLGISPTTIAPFVLRKIGYSQTRALFLTGERFDAAKARAIGLVHEVAEDDLDAAVREKVEGLLKGGPEALAATKALLRELRNAEPGEETTEILARRIAELRVGSEGQEGLGAFLEKREPAWREGS
jgi:methylglutaconyl-CoA hydratase